MKRGATDHPKTRRLAEAAGIPRYAALGLVEALVHFAARHVPDGAIGKFDDGEIAAAVEWDGQAEAMIEALLTAGFIERHTTLRLVIHDWFDHADDSVHMALARKGRTFWCGRRPKTTRFSKAERARVETLFEPSEHMEHAPPSPPRPPPARPSPPSGVSPSVSVDAARSELALLGVGGLIADLILQAVRPDEIVSEIHAVRNDEQARDVAAVLVHRLSVRHSIELPKGERLDAETTRFKLRIEALQRQRT